MARKKQREWNHNIDGLYVKKGVFVPMPFEPAALRSPTCSVGRLQDVKAGYEDLVANRCKEPEVQEAWVGIIGQIESEIERRLSPSAKVVPIQ